MGLLYVALLRKLVRFVPAALAAGKAVYHGRRLQKRASQLLHPRKDVIVMRKSTLLAILVFLSAVAGALGAMFLYLRRREAELEEYERLLFSEDFSYDETAGQDPLEALAQEAEEAPAAVAAVPAAAAKVAKKAPAKKVAAK